MKTNKQQCTYKKGVKSIIMFVLIVILYVFEMIWKGEYTGKRKSINLNYWATPFHSDWVNKIETLNDWYK